MKRYYIAIVFLIGVINGLKAQETTVEDAVYGIQTGVLGIWAHYEKALSTEFVLRTEVGFDTGLFGDRYGDGVGFVLAPVINLEPRWYYNIQKRTESGRNTVNNSANFLTASVKFHPDWFVISDHENMRVISLLSVVPKWGIKRSIGSHFTYEVGGGVGYLRILESNYFGNKNDVQIDIHLRFGYTF